MRSVAYNIVRLPNPKNAPRAIDVIWLLLRSLNDKKKKKKARDVVVVVTYNVVRLPSPVKAPLAIEVIWLWCRTLYELYVKTQAVMWLWL